MLYHRGFRIVPIIVALLCLHSLAGAAPSMPNWPQNFALANGEKSTFVVPVTAEGTVTAVVAWQGVPLTIAIADGQGKVVATAPGKTAPNVVLEYRIGARDLAAGPLWTVILSTTEGPNQISAADKTLTPTAKGSVSVTYPPINQTLINSVLDNARQQQLTSDASLKTQFESRTKAISTVTRATSSDLPPRPDGLALQEQIMLARFKQISAVVDLKKPPLTRIEPSIKLITPSNACPGDVVKVIAIGMNDPGQVDTVFRFANATMVAERAANPMVDNLTGEVILTVKVPKTTMTMNGPTAITVVLVDRSRNPYYMTNPVNFQYDPYPVPSISSVSPAAVISNGLTSVTGIRFQTGTVAHFIIPGLGDIASTSTVVKSESLLETRAPAFTTSTPLNGSLYVVGPGGKTSGQIPFITEINQSTVNLVYPTQAAPWETTTLSGTMLGNVQQVTYTVKPRNQQPAGTAYVAENLYSTDTTRTFQIIQKSDTALLLRVPSIQGFSGPLDVELTMTGKGKPFSVPFSIKPAYTTTYYRVPCTNMYFHKNEGGDNVKTGDLDLRYPLWLVGVRNANFFFGHKGDDVFWSTPWKVALEYNWTFGEAKVDVAAIVAGARLNNAGIYPVSMPGLPAGTMWVSVHWWADTYPVGMIGTVYYYVTATLKGPSGVPMMLNTTVSKQGLMPDGSTITLP
jgi:hypothetical protein